MRTRSAPVNTARASSSRGQAASAAGPGGSRPWRPGRMRPLEPAAPSPSLAVTFPLPRHRFQWPAMFFLHRLHLRVHHDDKRYECDECGKTFIRHDHLTKHKKIHSGEARSVRMFPDVFKKKKKQTLAKDTLRHIYVGCNFDSLVYGGHPFVRLVLKAFLKRPLKGT